MKKSWKTTLAGAISALGVYFTGLDGSWHTIGQVLAVMGPVLLGLFARDNNKTSEEVGATKK